MTERGQEVFNRLVQEYHQTKAAFQNSITTRTRLHLTIPLDEDYWEHKRGSATNKEPWKVMSQSNEFRFLRNMQAEGERQLTGGGDDIIEYLFVSRNDIYKGNTLAAYGTINAGLFRGEERFGDMEQYLKEEGKLSDNDRLPALSIVNLRLQSLADYLSNSVFSTSYDAIFPKLEDCIVSDHQLSVMMQALGCDESKLLGRDKDYVKQESETTLKATQEERE